MIFKRKHNWLMCWLYLGTFGSLHRLFGRVPAAHPEPVSGQSNALQYALLGPLVGALMRPLGGWLADKLGGARVTFWNFVAMAVAWLAVLHFLPQTGQAATSPASSACSWLLFLTTGIGNGSTFRMIPVIFLTERQRAAPGKGPQAKEQAVKDANKEAAAVLGFSSAHRRLRRLLHSQELRHLDRHDRRAGGRALCVHRFLPHLHRDHLVVLHPQKRGDALLSATVNSLRQSPASPT